MISDIINFNIKLFKTIMKWDDSHPYSFAFILATIAASYMLFNTPSLYITEEDFTPTEHIQFVDISKIEVQAPRRIVKKQFSTKDGDVSESTSNVNRAMGTSDEANAVDISYYPSIAPPKPVGRLKKLYPKLAKEMNIEAIINVELLIASNGKVRFVNILGIKLSKALPSSMHAKISSLFAKDAIKILMGAQFSPPIVKGKSVPIKMEMPLRFRLQS